eukprot:TRINITY_DN10589_c0_g1_i1.p1 TRINITY_DN10589_c0_g1~~TRINITY_DN10589_c0_g1_i1.p1  ORF type:complete len:278 (-),score=49.50 TRINITY_DN10589_c0_g1_i1:31-864(-)
MELKLSEQERTALAEYNERLRRSRAGVTKVLLIQRVDSKSSLQMENLQASSAQLFPPQSAVSLRLQDSPVSKPRPFLIPRGDSRSYESNIPVPQPVPAKSILRGRSSVPETRQSAEEADIIGPNIRSRSTKRRRARSSSAASQNRILAPSAALNEAALREKARFVRQLLSRSRSPVSSRTGFNISTGRTTTGSSLIRHSGEFTPRDTFVSSVRRMEAARTISRIATAQVAQEARVPVEVAARMLQERSRKRLRKRKVKKQPRESRLHTPTPVRKSVD